MVERFAVDTSTLLRYPQVVNEYKCVILSCVIRELEKHKISRDEDLRYQAREATRVLCASDVEFDFKDYSFTMGTSYDPNYTDNQILQACKDAGYGLITDDLLLKLKAKGFGVEVVAPSQDSQELYKGYKRVILTEEELAKFYEGNLINTYDLVLNEYLIICNTVGEALDAYKWTNRGLVKTKYKTIDSKYVGKVKALNVEQELYLDMLQDKTTKVKAVSGAFGSGKNHLSLAFFLDQIEKGNYERIVWIRNNIEASGSRPVGYLPGSLEDKLGVYAEILSDFIGEESEVKKLLSDGKIKLTHSGFIRGRDIRNSIIYVEEAQNVPNRQMMALIVSRCSANSMVFLNGDIEQTDGGISKDRNGLYSAIQTFKGHPNFAHVHLTKTERSETAEMANLLR